MLGQSKMFLHLYKEEDFKNKAVRQGTPKTG